MAPLSRPARDSLIISLASRKLGKEIADAIDAGINVSPINAIFRDNSQPPTADISWGGHKLIDLADPISAQDAATKNYVDTSIASIPPPVVTPSIHLDGSNSPTNTIDWNQQDIININRLKFYSGEIRITARGGFGGLDSVLIGLPFSNFLSGGQNVVVGTSSGQNMTTAHDNTLVGNSTGTNLTFGNKNTFIGAQAGVGTSANTVNATAVGFGALGGNGGGNPSEAVGIGYLAGSGAAASQGVYVGYEAGRNNNSGGGHTFVGYQAGRNVVSGNNNVFIGLAAGINHNSGDDCTFIGANVGNPTFSNLTGSRNILIGKDAQVSSAGASDELTIGPSIKGNINFVKISGSRQLILETTLTPASASAAGTTGEVVWDSNFIYVCIATNTWKRVSITTW